jgi:hypothetical protein
LLLVLLMEMMNATIKENYQEILNDEQLPVCT